MKIEHVVNIATAIVRDNAACDANDDVVEALARALLACSSASEKKQGPDQRVTDMRVAHALALVEWSEASPTYAQLANAARTLGEEVCALRREQVQRLLEPQGAPPSARTGE